MSEEQEPYVPDTPAEPAVETPADPEKKQPEFEPEVLLKKVENLAKENKNLIRSQQAMANQFKTMVDATVKAELAKLQMAKDEAIDLGDRQKVSEIEQQMGNVKQQAAAIQPTNQLDPAIADFVDSNKDWFNKDKEMTSFAVAYNESLLKEGSLSLEESLEKTLEKVKKAFPEKFESKEPKEDKKDPPPSPVEGASKSNVPNSRYTIGRLDPEQKIAYNQYVKVHKLISHDDYFKSLEEQGYLK